MCNLLSLSFSLYLSLPRSASQRRIDAVLWFPLTQFLSFKHTLTLPQHILMLNMRLNNLWQNITNTQGHVNATQKPHTHTLKIYLSVRGHSLWRADVKRESWCLLDLRIFSLLLHRDCTWGLRGWLGTKDKKGQKEREKERERERAEVVVIWDKPSCSFHMLEMTSCLYNSQKHWQELASHYTVHFVLLLGDGYISPMTIMITYGTLHHRITGGCHTDKCTDMSHYN